MSVLLGKLYVGVLLALIHRSVKLINSRYLFCRHISEKENVTNAKKDRIFFLL